MSEASRAAGGNGIPRPWGEGNRIFSGAFHAMEARPASQEGRTPTGKRPGLGVMSGMSAPKDILLPSPQGRGMSFPPAALEASDTDSSSRDGIRLGVGAATRNRDML